MTEILKAIGIKVKPVSKSATSSFNGVSVGEKSLEETENSENLPKTMSNQVDVTDWKYIINYIV